MNKYRLELIGITYNQIESGVYAVILQEVGSRRRIPIIIGYPEAQAIECKLQEVVTPRPLTHDMMMTFMSEFGIRLKEIIIHRLPTGVFAADMIFTDGLNTHTVDARSSDAIALAIRSDAPIYTTAEVLDEAGFEPGGSEIEVERKREMESARESEIARAQRLESLKEKMQKAAESENYEEAARLKAEIDKAENNG